MVILFTLIGYPCFEYSYCILVGIIFYRRYTTFSLLADMHEPTSSLHDLVEGAEHRPDRGKAFRAYAERYNKLVIGSSHEAPHHPANKPGGGVQALALGGGVMSGFSGRSLFHSSAGMPGEASEPSDDEQLDDDEGK